MLSSKRGSVTVSCAKLGGRKKLLLFDRELKSEYVGLEDG